jgi:hypothetical protein
MLANVKKEQMVDEEEDVGTSSEKPTTPINENQDSNMADIELNVDDKVVPGDEAMENADSNQN